MNPADLYRAITVEHGQVHTSGAALDSAPITALLAAYLGQDALTIADAVITSAPGDADVVVRGATTLAGVTVSGDFRFFLDAGVAQLALAGAPPADWTLGASFASLKGGYFDTFALAAPQWTLRSEANGSAVSGLYLDAGFTLPAPLEALRWFLAPAAGMTLSGPIALEGGLPVMTLSVSPHMHVSLGGLVAIDLTMRHRAMVQQGDADKAPVGVAISELTGNLSFKHKGQDVPVPLQAGFNEQLGLLELTLVTGAAFDVALDEIAHWLGGTDLGRDALPPAYRPAGGLTLHDVVFAVGLRTKTLEYVTLTIASSTPWQLAPKLSLTIDALSFMIAPGATQTLAATIDATLALGSVASLAVYACYPDFKISGHLADDSAIDLLPVLSWLGAVSSGVPSALKIDQLDFSAEPSSSNYAFAIEAVGNWQLVKALAVENLKASISYAGAALDLQFSGSFLVAGVDLEIGAEYDSDAGGWLFSGRTAQKTPIALGAFIAGLAADFSSSAASLLPDFIASLALKAIAVTFDTATKNFDFRCETTFLVGSTALELTLHVALTHNGADSYTHVFSGLLVIGSLAFELVFESAHDGATSSTTLLAAVQPGAGIDVRQLVGAISADAGQLMPPLTLTLDNALFLYRQAGAAPATYVFGLALGLDLNLQKLPLVGPVLSDQGIGALKDFQALYASAPVSADDAAAFNALLGEAGAKPLLPIKKGATGSTPVLSAGFNFAASLDMGDGPIALTAGGTSAPPDAPAPPPGVAPAPPAGNASWYDVHKSVGPATLDRIGLRYEGGRVWLLIDAGFTLSGLALGLQGLALGTKLDDRTALAVNLDGMSVEFSSGPLTIEGGFLHLGGDYLGAARVQAGTFGLTAIGGYAPADRSFFIFARLTAPLGGPPFFFVTGIAGGFGINRSLTIPPIDELAGFGLLPANNTFPATLGKDDPGRTLAATLAETETYIHPQAGMNWVAAGLDFTSFEMVDSSALATVSFGVDFAVALLGVTRVTVPKLDPEPIVYLEITLEAQFKPSTGLLAVDGRLTPASFLFAKLCRITGGFAFYLWVGGEHEGDFVISIGGYHPRFAKPDHYPVVPRLQLRYQIDALVMTGQSYLALTPHMVMAGMRIDATWESGSLSAWFSAGIDFLLGWRPFHYQADAYVHIGVALTLDLLFTSVSITIHVGVDLSIWGPPFGGNASIDLDIVSFTIHFGADQRQDTVDWAGFTSAFLPAPGKAGAATLRRALCAAAPDAAATLWCSASVSDGLAKDLQAADPAGFFDWLVDANHFTLDASTLIPAKAASYNGFELQAPFTASAGFKQAASGATPAALVDPALYPAGVTWATDFGVLPMQLAAADFQTALTVQLLRCTPGTSHTEPANYVDPVDTIAVTPLVKSASAALWAKADPGLNGDRLIADALVGLRLTPMAQHPDITLQADLWAMLFNHEKALAWQARVPAADKSDSYQAAQQDAKLSFTLAGERVNCNAYLLSALTLDAVAAQRRQTVAALAALGLALDPAAIDVAGLAAYPLWDWPAIRTLGEEQSA